MKNEWIKLGDTPDIQVLGVCPKVKPSWLPARCLWARWSLGDYVHNTPIRV